MNPVGLLGVVAMLSLVACGSNEKNHSSVAESTMPPPESTPLGTTATGPTSSALTTIAEPPSARDIRQPAPTFLAIGEIQPVQIWASCGVYLNIGDERYVPDRWIGRRPIQEYRQSDFPDEWEVVIYNQAPSDGPDWAILDAVVERLDSTTLEVRHEGTGDVIAVFERDFTPDSEIGRCG